MPLENRKSRTRDIYLIGSEENFSMGMLLDGRWVDQDAIIKDGAFLRAASSIRMRNTRAVVQEISRRPKDFWLIGSHSCPWSHRVLLTCAIRKLPLPIHHAFGPRIQGYALNGGESWVTPGTSVSARNMHELYTQHDPSFTGRVTVPILWDAGQQKIVSNESADMLVVLDVMKSPTAHDFTLRPADLLSRIETANKHIYEGLNNAVYRAGFAESQSAYDEAVSAVFDTLDLLDRRLATSRYYFGTVITETDLRIFPTLVRFDAVYAILFKCSRRRLTDYHNLWAYARDMFALKGVKETVDFNQIRRASYLADSRDPIAIIAIAPDANWREPHDRAELGNTQFSTRSGAAIAVDPVTLSPLPDD